MSNMKDIFKFKIFNNNKKYRKLEVLLSYEDKTSSSGNGFEVDIPFDEGRVDLQISENKIISYDAYDHRGYIKSVTLLGKPELIKTEE